MAQDNKLDEKEVLSIAKLAKLNLSDEQIPNYQNALGNILNLVEEMQSTDTENVAPLNHPLDAVNRLRADEVTENDQRETYQQVAPKTEEGLYLVPKVIE